MANFYSKFPLFLNIIITETSINSRKNFMKMYKYQYIAQVMSL